MPNSETILSLPNPRSPSCPSDEDHCLSIALVNNMPDAALQATERQYRELLASAAGGRRFRLRLFSLPGHPRSEAARLYLSYHYDDVSNLWPGRLDGMIVTGAEPRTSYLADEPYWRTFTELVEWAEQHTTSTIWSCLAAHAAVLHLDKIQRRPLPEKLFGIFDCLKASDHEMLAGFPISWRVPHSRWNDLPEQALRSAGYRILSTSPRAGVDLFSKQTESLFVFSQGHLEYDSDTLFREYRRDIARFLCAKSNRYPKLPENYLEERTATALVAFQGRALWHRDIDMLRQFPPPADGAQTKPWSVPAINLYAYWLSYLAGRKTAGQCT